MTPTRALIEAAQLVVDYRQCPDRNEFREGIWQKLEAAIASAKAAEEEVETAWHVEYKAGDRWLKDYYKPGSKEDAERRLQYVCVNTRKVRLVRYDTYTTVIEVREKEGV